jgi:hypothetical protein
MYVHVYVSMYVPIYVHVDVPMYVHTVCTLYLTNETKRVTASKPKCLQKGLYFPTWDGGAAQWQRVRLRNRRSLVLIPPGCKVFTVFNIVFM